MLLPGIPGPDLRVELRQELQGSASHGFRGRGLQDLEESSGSNPHDDDHHHHHLINITTTLVILMSITIIIIIIILMLLPLLLVIPVILLVLLLLLLLRPPPPPRLPLVLLLLQNHRTISLRVQVPNCKISPQNHKSDSEHRNPKYPGAPSSPNQVIFMYYRAQSS